MYVSENTTSTESTSKAEFKIYPNPSRGITNVSISSTSSGPVHMDIFSVEGKKVYHDKYHVKKGVNEIPFFFPLEKGNYIMSLRLSDSTTYSEIFIVK